MGLIIVTGATASGNHPHPHPVKIVDLDDPTASLHELFLDAQIELMLLRGAGLLSFERFYEVELAFHKAIQKCSTRAEMQTLITTCYEVWHDLSVRRADAAQDALAALLKGGIDE